MTALDMSAGWTQGDSSRATVNFGLLKAWKQHGEKLGIPQAIREIWAERQWLVLGHDSFDAACKAILGEEWRLPLPIDERRELVAELRGDGMSTRAIASAVGAPKSTIADDLAQLSGSGQLPDTVTGLDGKNRKAHVTTTTRTTEATKVEHDIDLVTGEILPGPGLPDPEEDARPITSEQWQEENPDLGKMLAADPEVRAANLRHDLSKWMVELTKPYLFPAEEMAAIAPDKADRIAELVAGMNQWHDNYRAALRRSRMTVVGGQR